MVLLQRPAWGFLPAPMRGGCCGTDLLGSDLRTLIAAAHVGRARGPSDRPLSSNPRPVMSSRDPFGAWIRRFRAAFATPTSNARSIRLRAGRRRGGFKRLVEAPSAVRAGSNAVVHRLGASAHTATRDQPP